MFKNYLKFTIRNLLKRKTYSVINVIGLAIGIASFILIALYIIDEYSYDRYHKNANNIYRLVQVGDFGGVVENSSSAPFPVAPTILADYPQYIKSITRVFNFQNPRTHIECGENDFNEKGLFYVDSTFFEIFDVEFVTGNPKKALNSPNSAVITESMARKYFDADNPIGKYLKLEEGITIRVNGIIKDTPSQSHFKYNILVSLSTVRQVYGGYYPKTWVWNPCWTYILLKDGVTKDDLEKHFPEYIDKYFYDAEKDKNSLYLQALTDIHLNQGIKTSTLDFEIEPQNNISYIYLLGAIGLFLLIIACINFMNLATAASAGRAKEIGIKKVLGANRQQLILQLLSEAVLLSFLALIIAVSIVEIVLPAFNDFTDKSIELGSQFRFGTIALIVSLGLVIGLLSGLYPAFFLSNFKTVNILKGNLQSTVKSGNARKLLVIVQFTISIILFIGTWNAMKQISFLRNANLGFDKEQIILLHTYNTPLIYKYDKFKAELLQNPYIENVTALEYIIGADHNNHEYKPEVLSEDQWQYYPTLIVQYDFIKTFNIEIIAGRDYSKEMKTDRLKGILINEAMVKHLGWGNPEDALGKKFYSQYGKEKIIGVFKNFNAKSLHSGAQPFVLDMKERPKDIAMYNKFIAVKVSKGENKSVLDNLEKKWYEFAPNRPFEYSFLEKELDCLYEDEENLAFLTGIFSIIVIFIAGIGLFGLTSFLAEQRTKEIGIRKVLGAGIVSIFKVLAKEFIILIALSNVLAWALAYWIVSIWLQNFAYRITINWLEFVYSGTIVFVIALLIISTRVYIAAQSDPVDTLKYE